MLSLSHNLWMQSWMECRHIHLMLLQSSKENCYFIRCDTSLYVCVSAALLKMTFCFHSLYCKWVESEAVFLVRMWTRFFVVFPYSSCLAGNELVPSLTKNTASGIVIFRHFLGLRSVDNLRACCLPWSNEGLRFCVTSELYFWCLDAPSLALCFGYWLWMFP